ncbi:MAG: hypothetical protein RI897_3931 [Verrucomicrobiota bacterium]
MVRQGLVMKRESCLGEVWVGVGEVVGGQSCQELEGRVHEVEQQF